MWATGDRSGAPLRSAAAEPLLYHTGAPVYTTDGGGSSRTPPYTETSSTITKAASMHLSTNERTERASTGKSGGTTGGGSATLVAPHTRTS